MFDLWTGLLRGYGQAQLEEPLNEQVRWLLLRDLQRGIVEPEVGESWSRAAETAAELLPELVRCVSEVGSAELPSGDVVPLRAEVGGELVRAMGGRSLVLEGTVLRRVEPSVPVLWGVDRHDVVVDPSSVEWQETTSGWTWRAVFDARDLPLHLNLQVAIRVRGVVVAVAAAGGLPEYSVLDRFIFEHHRESVVIYRRRSVPVRAVRRTVIKLRDRATNGRR